MLSRVARLYRKLKGTPTLGRARRYGLNQELKYIDSILDKITEKGVRELTSSFTSYLTNIYADILDVFEISANTPRKKFKSELEFAWSGLTYDTRLRNVGDKLSKDVRDTIIQGLRKQEDLEVLLNRLEKLFDRYINRVERIQRVDTEHFINVASTTAYKKLKLDKVMWYARIDERTCPVCGDLHTQIFNIDQVPTIPQHPNCRCRLIPIQEL